MQEDKIISMINLYFDGELTRNEEVNLFSLLTDNENGRDYFKKLILIRNTVENSKEEFPIELEERILRSVGSKLFTKTGIFSGIRIFSAISYAAAVILLFLSGYLFFRITSYQERVDNLSQQMMLQSKTIQMLYNSLPGIEVHAAFDNEIIIKPNI